MIFSGVISKHIILDVQSPLTSFESSRSNGNQISKFDPKFDLSDIVYLLAISSKPTEQQNNVRKVSYPKFHALSIDTTCSFISLILLMVAAFM